MSENMEDFKELKSCRLCGSVFYSEVLELRKSPLANELYNSKVAAQNADKFPLTLAMCSNCKHVQLRHIVNPERLFASYVYRSGTSQSFQIHFDELAEKIVQQHGSDIKVLEIGSNDGTLLKSLRDRGVDAVGIEPSESLCKLSKDMNLNVVHGMLDNDTIEKSLPGDIKAQIIVANNVFAHIDDMPNALALISSNIELGGSFIFEVAHLKSLIENSLFDTIYHEHMSYHSVLSLIPFLQSQNFSIYRVEEIPTHGGSIRIFARKVSDKDWTNIDVEILKIIDSEIRIGLDSPQLLVKLSESIDQIRTSSISLLSELENSYELFGYGAPAKLVTFMNELGLESLPFVGVVDDNEDKQSKFLPGSGIEIVPSKDLVEQAKKSKRAIAVVIFPWNLKDEIITKLQSYLPKGSKAIWLLPTPEMVTF